MSGELHVIFGSGPVSCWTARALRAQGKRVRAVNRSGTRPGLMPADVEMLKADLADPHQASEAASGATVLYQALNPPYHKWHELFPPLQAAALAAARATNARYVSIENLYLYDASSPISEASKIAPRSTKGALRQQMAEAVMAAHARGDVRATALRPADFFGPGVTESALGARCIGNLVHGKAAQLTGSATMPHCFSYIEDVGRAAATIGVHDEALGHAWIAPASAPITQAQVVEAVGRILGVEPKMTTLSPLMMRLAGLFVPAARASVEMMYQFTEPFVVEASQIERAFGLTTTPFATALERTVAWYRRS